LVLPRLRRHKARRNQKVRRRLQPRPRKAATSHPPPHRVPLTNNGHRDWKLSGRPNNSPLPPQRLRQARNRLRQRPAHRKPNHPPHLLSPKRQSLQKKNEGRAHRRHHPVRLLRKRSNPRPRGRKCLSRVVSLPPGERHLRKKLHRQRRRMKLPPAADRRSRARNSAPLRNVRSNRPHGRRLRRLPAHRRRIHRLRRKPRRMRLQLRPASLPRNRHRPRQIQLTRKSQKKTRGKNSARLVVLSANHIRERATPGAPRISASVDGLFHFKPNVQCRLLAQSGRENHVRECPLSGVKRTSVLVLRTSVPDPTETSAGQSHCVAQRGHRRLSIT
jgi:hypothetical protein